ncbi:MAG: hypothetical protein ACUVXI_04240 [bacterium]
MAEVVFTKDEVKIRREDKTLKASVGMNLRIGDVIITGKDSRADLKLKNGAVIRLGEMTTVNLRELIESYDLQSVVWARGTWEAIKRITIGSQREAKPTAQAAVRGVEATSELEAQWREEDKEPSAEVYYFIGEAYSHLARMAYKKALETHPGSEYGIRAKEKLK